MMPTIVLIPIAWLSVVALCWSVCAMAQHGDTDEPSLPSVERGASRARPGLAGWEDLAELSSEPALSARDARRLTARAVR